MVPEFETGARVIEPSCMTDTGRPDDEPPPVARHPTGCLTMSRY